MNELHFDKAPITEAVIEIRVKPSVDVSLEELSKQLSVEDYPGQKKRFEVSFEVGEEKSSTMRKLVGYAQTDKSGKQVWQYSLTSFSLSRLAPYGSWIEFSAEARRLWEVYKAAVSPVAITRAAVRYINRIDLPLPVGSMTEYLRTYPEVSFGSGISSYLMRLESPRSESFLVLHQALVPPASEDVVSILLDIDLYRDKEFEANDDTIWSTMDKLRAEKNEIFLACLTENTLRLFE